MKTENVMLMRQAREALTGKWGLAIGTCLVYGLIIGCFQIPIRAFTYMNFKMTFGIGAILINGPLALGIAYFSLALWRKQEAKFSQLFKGFDKFGTSIAAYLLVSIFTFLWMLLLIVPGIIAAISYSQTFYIIAQDDSISASQAIDKSKKMMDGYKLKYFYLCLRFFGLGLLCILTLGIGFLWLMPYTFVTCAGFYEDIKEQTVSAVT